MNIPYKTYYSDILPLIIIGKNSADSLDYSALSVESCVVFVSVFTTSRA